MSTDNDLAQNDTDSSSNPQEKSFLEPNNPLINESLSSKDGKTQIKITDSDEKTVSTEEVYINTTEDQNQSIKIIPKGAKRVTFNLEPEEIKEVGFAEDGNVNKKIQNVKVRLEEPDAQVSVGVIDEKTLDTTKSTENLELDLEFKEKVDVLQPSHPDSLKTELIVSLEKLDTTDTKNKTKLDKLLEESSTVTEIVTPNEPTILPDNSSPVQEKSPDSEKNSFNLKDSAKDGTHIRTSARVNKRKLEQEHDRRILGNSPPSFKPDDDGILSDHPLNQVFGSVISTNLNEDSRSPHVRTSARVIKKMRLEAVTPLTSKSEPVEKKDKKDDSKPERSQKAVRPWFPEEKTMFFEAVSEYGKDFENIYSYIHTKLKKRGYPDAQNRTKDQVIRFYYKIFHEVSRHVKFSDKIKKVVQELYGIINYGELYKKLGILNNEKSCAKLTEMIYRGSTIIKHKGRTLRVKTPMCRALRKLNQLEDNYEELQLPNRVTVEIRPKDMAAFYMVQSIAQNPRLRTALPLQKRLDTLLVCLNKRWKTLDATNYEKAFVASDPITSELVEGRPQMPEEKAALNPPLRLSPPLDAKIELPSINLSEYLTRQTICLTAFEARLGLDTYSDLQLKKKTLKQKTEAEQKCDTICDVSIIKDENEINSSNETEPDVQVSDSVDSAINTILSLRQKLDRQDSEQSESEDIQPSMISFGKEPKKETKDEKTFVLDAEMIAKIDRIRKGWTEADCGSLTMGELYLMYGADSKLVLEYSWDISDENNTGIRSSAHFLERWSEFFDDYVDEHSNLSFSLSKLLSIAKLHYRRNIIKCPCGHICSEKSSQNSKHSSNMGSTSTPRVRKMSLESVNFKDEPNIPGTSNPGMHNLLEDSNHVRDDLLEQENMFEDSEMISFARKPMYIQPKSTIPLPTMEQQLDSIQKLKPKYCNRKGRRARSKQVVVERKLPLLPNNIESGHQIVRMNIICQEPVPEAPPLEKVVGQLEENVMSEENEDDEAQSEDNMKTIDRVNDSPPLLNTGTTSPSRILKEGEWIGSEVADYSLSSLLGHLESPVKTSNVTNTTTDLSNQLDAHLRSLMTQNSLDFAASFAELARVTCQSPCEDSALKKEG